MLTGEEETEYQALRLKVLEVGGLRAGLAKKDADSTDKARLRELIEKQNPYPIKPRTVFDEQT